MSTAAELLGANGPFIDLVDGFDPRETQQSLATAIEQQLADHEALIAGTRFVVTLRSRDQA